MGVPCIPRLPDPRTDRIGLLAVFVIAGGRDYYAPGIYPVCFAAGAVELERRRSACWRGWLVIWPVAASAVGVGLSLLPGSPAESDHREQADRVAMAYRSLPPDTRGEVARTYASTSPVPSSSWRARRTLASARCGCWTDGVRPGRRSGPRCTTCEGAVLPDGDARPGPEMPSGRRSPRGGAPHGQAGGARTGMAAAPSRRVVVENRWPGGSRELHEDPSPCFSTRSSVCAGRIPAAGRHPRAQVMAVRDRVVSGAGGPVA